MAGDYVIDQEYGSSIVMVGFSSEEHIAVVYRVRDGLIHDVILLMRGEASRTGTRRRLRSTSVATVPSADVPSANGLVPTA